MKIDKSEIIKNFIDIKNIANINLLVCYKILFSIKGLSDNYGSFCLMTVILLNYIIIIIFCAKNSLKKIQCTINDIAFGIKNFNLLQPDNMNKKYQKNITKKRDNEEKISNKLKGNLKNKSDKKKTFKFASKKETKIEKIKFAKKEDNKINNSNSRNIFNLDITDIKRNIKKDNKKFNKRLNTTSNFRELLIKIGKIMKYNDEELNNLNYNLALQIDKRNYCQYYYSLLKTKHDILFTFCNNTDYNSQIVKIHLLIFNFALEFTINALFFSDDTMHKIYEDKGSFNFIYQLPQIIYSSIIADIFNYFLRMLALSQDAILNLKSVRINTYLNKSKICLYFKIKIKIIFYFIFSSIFLLFFWYYISMFCAIYINTQIHLIKDTLISFIFSFVYPFFINLLPGIFRIPSLSNINTNRKFLYIISKIFQMI